MGLPQNNYGCGDCRRLLEEDFHWVWRLQKTFGRGLALDVETAGDFRERERTFTGCRLKAQGEYFAGCRDLRL